MRILLSALLLASATGVFAAPAATEAPEARAQRVLGEAPLTDGHNDWPFALRMAYGVDGAKTADLDRPVSVTRPDGTVMTGHTSIPLLRQGHVGIQLWSVYVPAGLPPAAAVKMTFEQIAIARSLPVRRPDAFTFVTTAAEAEKAWKSGRIASFVAMEGAHQVADDIATLRRAYTEGARSMTLAHSQPTELFDSATAPPRHNGIAPAAPVMIAEMNRLGMLVDLSHVSPAVMNAVLDITKAPVIFSHSSARALTNHSRDVPDDVLKRMAKNGGIVMATFVPAFVDQARYDWQNKRDAAQKQAGTGAEAEARMKAWDSANPRPVTTLAMVADHIDHIARVAGHDHVGIGGDFDGVPDLPVGLENVSKYPALFAELARRGWSDQNLRKLAGENFLRVLKANEAVAKRFSAARK